MLWYALGTLKRRTVWLDTKDLKHLGDWAKKEDCLIGWLHSQDCNRCAQCKEEGATVTELMEQFRSKSFLSGPPDQSLRILRSAWDRGARSPIWEQPTRILLLMNGTIRRPTWGKVWSVDVGDDSQSISKRTRCFENRRKGCASQTHIFDSSHSRIRGTSCTQEAIRIMLTTYRRHNPAKCKFTSRSEYRCKCPIWVTGTAQHDGQLFGKNSKARSICSACRRSCAIGIGSKNWFASGMWTESYRRNGSG